MERLAARRGRALWAGGTRRSGADQRLASVDAGVTKVAGDFLVNVRRMKEGGGAVEECDERERQASVLVRGAAELRSELALDEFERRHVLFAGEGHSPIFGDEAVIIGMGDEEIEGTAASLQRRGRGPDSGEKIEAGAAAKHGKEIALVGEALVERGSGGASGAGHGTHGEGLLAAFAPNAVRGIEDTAFQKSISFAGHGADLLILIAWDYILYSVKPTVYK
jgi:hypothetical protein